MCGTISNGRSAYPFWKHLKEKRELDIHPFSHFTFQPDSFYIKNIKVTIFKYENKKHFTSIEMFEKLSIKLNFFVLLFIIQYLLQESKQTRYYVNRTYGNTILTALLYYLYYGLMVKIWKIKFQFFLHETELISFSKARMYKVQQGNNRLSVLYFIEQIVNYFLLEKLYLVY